MLKYHLASVVTLLGFAVLFYIMAGWPPALTFLGVVGLSWALIALTGTKAWHHYAKRRTLLRTALVTANVTLLLLGVAWLAAAFYGLQHPDVQRFLVRMTWVELYVALTCITVELVVAVRLDHEDRAYARYTALSLLATSQNGSSQEG